MKKILCKKMIGLENAFREDAIGSNVSAQSEAFSDQNRIIIEQYLSDCAEYYLGNAVYKLATNYNQSSNEILTRILYFYRICV